MVSAGDANPDPVPADPGVCLHLVQNTSAEPAATTWPWEAPAWEEVCIFSSFLFILSIIPFLGILRRFQNKPILKVLFYFCLKSLNRAGREDQEKRC